MTMSSKLCDLFARLRRRSVACKLYEQVGKYASVSPTTICMLHEAEPKTPCPSSAFFCGTEIKIPALNFDAVKEAFCNKTKTSSVPSVDAVLYKDNRFLFVEIKSWQNFERFQIKPCDNQATIQQKIADKAAGFKLKPKVEKSMAICKSICKDEHLFEKMLVTYVLVTDVDTVVDPLARFRGRLRALAYKSVFIPLFSSASLAQLSTVGMDVRYVFCRKFDSFYDSL